MSGTKENCFQTFLATEIGYLQIVGNERGILAIRFQDQEPVNQVAAPDLLLACRSQLKEYFDGKRQCFSLPLCLRGTSFQMDVWRQLLEIPFGQIRSYGWIARKIGNPRAARAVGAANHRNPLTIVVPCHRVVGSDGRLVGYGGGLWRKEWLLEHEKEYLGRSIDFTFSGGNESWN